METYNVRRPRAVEFLARAMESSGLRILEKPSPRRAPFVFRVLTPAGESLELICYAFTANRYRQEGRPEDEHRFQIKYGSEFDRYHSLFVGTGEESVTLFFGIHYEANVIVACDPMMHNPTWFSKSVEFKDADLNETLRTGWHGWERERKAQRRKRERPLADLNYETEIVVGLTPEHFFRYVQMERAGTGLPSGERLLLIDRMSPSHDASDEGKLHPLEEELGLSARDILNMIEGAFRLKVAVRGATAEQHLGKLLEHTQGVDEVRHLDADGQPDFEVLYRGQGPIAIECKNVLRRRRAGQVRVDFQRTRASKSDPCSRYYRASEFHLLAACLHPVTESWEFTYARTRDLHPHPTCDGRLDHRLPVEDDTPWESETAAALESVFR